MISGINCQNIFDLFNLTEDDDVRKADIKGEVSDDVSLERLTVVFDCEQNSTKTGIGVIFFPITLGVFRKSCEVL